MGNHVFYLSGDHIDFGNTVDLIAEKLNADCCFTSIGWKNLHYIPAHTEFVSDEIDIIALILQFDQFFGQFIALLLHSGTQRDYHVAVIDWVTQRIDAGNTGNDDDIPAFGQCRSSRMSELLDLIIDCTVLFDIGIGIRDIGLRLIIVVVRDEVFHRIIWKKRLKLRAKLCCQRLVVCQNQSWTIYCFDNIGHGKSFTRTGNTQQCLFLVSMKNTLCQLLDCLRLVSSRLIGRYQLKSFFFLHFLPFFPIFIFVISSLISYDFSTTQT